MRRFRKAWLVGAVVIVIGVLVAGCGGGDTSDTEAAATTEAPAATTETAATAEEAVEEPATSGAADTGTTGAASDNPFLANGEGSGCTGDPVVLGWTRAESGYQAFYDVSISGGAELAIEDYEAAGCPGSGRPIEIVYADYKSDIELVPGATQQVLDQGAEIIITGCDYDLGGPAARIANDQQMLAVGCAGGTLFGVEGIGPYVFNTWHGNPTEGAVMAEFAAEQGWSKPFMLVDTSVQYSKEGCQFAEQRLNELGIPPVGKATFLQGDQSFSSQVSQVRQASDADVLLICSFPPGGATLIKQLRDAGVEQPIIGQGAGFDGSHWQEAVGNLSDFYDSAVLYSLFGDDPNAFLNQLTERFTETTGEPPAVSNFAVGYVTIELIAQALTQTSGSTNGDDLKDAMNTFTDLPTILGPVTYTPECHVVFGRELRVLQTTDGTPHFFETIQPESVPDAPC